MRLNPTVTDSRSSSRFLFNRRLLVLGALGSTLWHQGRIDQSKEGHEVSINEALPNDHVQSVCTTLANCVCPLALFRGKFADAEHRLALIVENATTYELHFGLS